MAEPKAKEEGESESSSERTPPLYSPTRRSPSPNPRKRKNSNDLLPSLSNCHSCSGHYPPRSQTLTSLHPLDSEWRIVLLCDHCLRLVKSAAKCSYCFSDFSGGGGDRLLGCRQCSCRIHFDCVPAQQRFISPAILNPESFVCVDCCALPRFGNKNRRSLFTAVSLEELVREVKEKEAAAARAKEKAFEKVTAAKWAADRAKEALGAVAVVEIDPVVRDEELALQLHLAINGSQRILRDGRSRSSEAKKVKQSNGCPRSFEKVEFCTEDKSFFDSWDSSVELGLFERKEPKKEIDERSGSPPEIVVEEQGSSSDKVVNSGEDNNTLPVLITYQRASKSRGVGSRERSSEMKQNLNGVGAEESFSESEQMSRHNPPDRYAKKYSKRKSILKKGPNGENGVVSCLQTSCSKACTFSDAPLSSLSGCRS